MLASRFGFTHSLLKPYAEEACLNWTVVGHEDGGLGLRTNTFPRTCSAGLSQALVDRRSGMILLGSTSSRHSSRAPHRGQAPPYWAFTTGTLTTIDSLELGPVRSRLITPK